jgi:hypothetical protein
MRVFASHLRVVKILRIHFGKPSMALIGYARVSTDDQTLGPQLDGLKGVGCTEIFEEFASGADRARADVNQCGVRPHLRMSNGSWRVDETYVKVKGRRMYLYRAVDSRAAASRPSTSCYRPSATLRRRNGSSARRWRSRTRSTRAPSRWTRMPPIRRRSRR